MTGTSYYPPPPSPRQQDDTDVPGPGPGRGRRADGSAPGQRGDPPRHGHLAGLRLVLPRGHHVVRGDRRVARRAGLFCDRITAEDTARLL
jgi:hypothetical protein